MILLYEGGNEAIPSRDETLYLICEVKSYHNVVKVPRIPYHHSSTEHFNFFEPFLLILRWLDSMRY